MQQQQQKYSVFLCLEPAVSFQSVLWTTDCMSFMICRHVPRFITVSNYRRFATVTTTLSRHTANSQRIEKNPRNEHTEAVRRECLWTSESTSHLLSATVACHFVRQCAPNGRH